MMVFIYILSFFIVGMSAMGIIINSCKPSVKSIGVRDTTIILACVFVPILNTLAALVIVITTIWLLFFRHDHNPKPPT